MRRLLVGLLLCASPALAQTTVTVTGDGAATVVTAGTIGPVGATGATGPTGPAGATFDGGSVSNPLSVLGTLGSDLVTIDATCTGWTFSGSGWACGGDGTVTKLSDGYGSAAYGSAEVGATYKIVVVTSSGTYAGIPYTRPLLVGIGNAVSEFISSDTTTTFYRTAQTTDGLYLTTEANGATSVPRAKFTVSVRKVSGGGLAVEGQTTLNGPTAINGRLLLAGGFEIRAEPTALSIYLGRGIAPGLQTHVLGNTVLGTYAGLNLTSGGDNTLVGTNVGSSITTGAYNTAVGVDSMMRVATTGSNSAFGKTALWGVTGADNTAIGVSSFYSAAGTGTAAQNVGVGNYVGYSVTSGADNAFLGYKAGYSLTTGGQNVCIGRDSCYTTGQTYSVSNALNTASGGTFVGYRAGFKSSTQRANSGAFGQGAYVDADNTIALGNDNVTDVLASSDGGATVTAGAFKVGSNTGISGTVVVKGSDGNNCNLVFAGGIVTSETCP